MCQESSVSGVSDDETAETADVGIDHTTVVPGESQEPSEGSQSVDHTDPHVTVVPGDNTHDDGLTGELAKKDPDGVEADDDAETLEQ